jgi:hypothetical protein
MKTCVPAILILLLGLFSPGAGVTAQSTGTQKFPGFLGTYHPFNGTAYGGDGWTEGATMQEAFDFGENAILSAARYNGFTFAENVENNCHAWNVNKVYGILTPPTEKGVVNQPSDTSLLMPFAPAGMIQGAHRFSELSKTCPQLAGMMIDDFYNDYPKLVTAKDLRDIRAALAGKTVGADGVVDHSSRATTPALKLFIVTYEHQIDRVDPEVLANVDGVNFWIWKQNENYANYAEYIDRLRKNYPGKEIVSGVYIFNSGQTPTAASIHSMIETATGLYSKGKINGLLFFSAIWLSREKITRERWNDLALPKLLDRVYYSHLGGASVKVVDAQTKLPVKGAVVTASRNAGGQNLLVARKLTNDKGEFTFGGWAAPGSSKYSIEVSKDGSSAVAALTLKAGKQIKPKPIRLPVNTRPLVK